MPEDIHWQKYSQRFKTFPTLLEHFESNAEIVVCLPVFAEPGLITTLESLRQCEVPRVKVEVLLFFNKNSRMTADELVIHEKAWEECKNWIAQNQVTNINFLPIFLDQFPDLKGGVGWARKMVMDEAARRLGQEGIIVCLDADCTVAKNYLREIGDFFNRNKDSNAASIYYEHQLEGLDSRTRNAIVDYELHLRYLVHAKRWTGHPFAFHTVGSSMAVRRKSYLEQGGMNTRQAGEDFYFLQKFIEIGDLLEINSTCVFPSARISGRVPFGTGKAMQKVLVESEAWMTTDFKVYRLIRPLFQNMEKLNEYIRGPVSNITYEELQKTLSLDPRLISFLEHIDFISHCINITKHTSGFAAFLKRFFRYFNSFMMIRYMHYIRELYFPDIPVFAASKELAGELKLKDASFSSVEKMLEAFRHLDRNDYSTN